jgi:RNA polymerase sigma factor (sigma-70 family)
MVDAGKRGSDEAQPRGEKGNRVKGVFRKFWRSAFGKPARKQLAAAVEKLSLYCHAPDLRAEGATDLDEVMKYRTWWPENDLLKQIENSVLTLASTERKNPSRRIWGAFELVDKRTPKLHLVKEINALAKRAQERLTDAGRSKLEEISGKYMPGEKQKDIQSLRRDIAGMKEEGKAALSLLCDIAQMKRNLGSAKAIDWSQHKRILLQFSGEGHVELACGKNTASDDVRCYARALELIVDDYNFEPLRKKSRPLAEWLIEIGHLERGEFEELHPEAARAVFLRELGREGVKREAKWAKFRQSERVIKKSKEDIEDERLMMLVREGDADALAELRKRHEGVVKKVAREITRSNSTTDDIIQRTFIQVWKHAHTYVPVAKFTSWVTKIAKNLALNEGKRARSVKERVEFDHVSETGSKGSQKKNKIGDSADESADFSSCPGEDFSMEDGEEASGLLHIGEDDRSHEHLKALPGALSQLSEREQRVLTDLQGMGCKRKTPEALAAEMGMTVGDVKTVEREALDKMRQILGDS